MMEISNNNNNQKCTTHKRSIEIICYQCNKLMCSACLIIHNKQFKDHTDSCDHIEYIKQSLSNYSFSNSNNNGADDNDNQDEESNCCIKTRISDIWSKLKDATTNCKSLETTEAEISAHFAKLHEFLVVEEHKLKKPIVSDLLSLTQQIETNIDELKYLSNLITLNQKINNSNNNSNSSATSSSSTTTTKAILDIYSEVYSTKEIIKSLVDSESLQSFIQSNIDTLFNHENNSQFNLNDLQSQYGSNTDFMILDLLFKFNDQFKVIANDSNSSNNNNNNNCSLTVYNDNTDNNTNNNNNQPNQSSKFDYRLITNPINNNLLSTLINQSIGLTSPKSSSSTSPTTTTTSTTTNPVQKQYLFTTHTNKGATLISLSDLLNNNNNNNNITPVEEMKFKIGFYGTFSAMVTIGEYIYIFGGRGQPHKYHRYSIKSKSIDIASDIPKMTEYISVCYDQKEYIYVLGGNRLDRFNTKSMEFERYLIISDESKKILSLFYKGMLYSIPESSQKILGIDTNNRKVESFTSRLLFEHPVAACHDSNGNIFILGIDGRFLRFNIDDRSIIMLSSTAKSGHYLSMLYHQVSKTENYVFLLGGGEHKNHRYSIEQNIWVSIFSDDIQLRNDCGSSIIEFLIMENRIIEDDDDVDLETTSVTSTSTATTVTKERRFEDLGLAPWLLACCKQLGFKAPSNIQYNTIPAILSGRDILASAKTGQGKTAAFALPILSALSEDPYGIFAVVLTPTRELAVQIGEQFRALGSAINVNCCVVIGGIDNVQQSLILDKRPHIIVATPGRLAAHLNNGMKLALQFCRFLVLDEADRMLGPDFELEVQKIVEHLPPKIQTLLYSATMTNSNKKLESIPIKNPYIFEDNNKYDTVETLSQYYVFMPAQAKDCHLVYLLKKHDSSSVIVFINNCRTVEAVKGMLNKLDIKSVSLHSFLSQKDRLNALKQFKSGKIRVLIATDVASRGLDIPDVQMVINYKLSNSSKDYIHRVGRTARFGRSGRAISFVTPHDVELVKNVEAAIGKQLELYTTEDEAVYRHLGEASTARKLVEIYLDEIEFGVKEKERRDERNELTRQMLDEKERNTNNNKESKTTNSNDNNDSSKKNNKKKDIKTVQKESITTKTAAAATTASSSKPTTTTDISKKRTNETLENKTKVNRHNNDDEDSGISLFKKKKK
ncbi:putative RNA helicase [Heterostelium album PN500]|uniref:Putative RNA helicase n=1 Tax=Heterostelium pallidum (strain ATCC 26659 / Pp 5 / PN500) TaxID=670386 RepID=D3BPI7_HETP5|nr:putative RNA helicase [Heterostelium album PN500]EFA76705.1 putative RNA helicase [Heterostelium album PN500]|eukprot:XP_020428837.1 putative RNA helicase [Heterostelium album PN500]